MFAHGGANEFKEYDEVHFELYDVYRNKFLLFHLDTLSIRWWRIHGEGPILQDIADIDSGGFQGQPT